MPTHARFRILMLAACPLPLPRGSQVLIAGLAKALQDRGHAVEIVAYAAGMAHPRPAVPVRRARGPLLRSRLDPRPSLIKPLLDLLLAGEARRVARRFRPNLLHAHNFEGLAVGLWLRRQTALPLVYHQHNLLEPELPSYFRFPPLRWAGRVLGRWADHALPRQADACIVLHPEAADYLQRCGAHPARVHIVPPGVELPEQGGPSTAAVRQRYGLAPGPLVLYSGNLDHYQDLELLGQAFGLVRRARGDAQLVVATHQRAPARRTAGETLLRVGDWEEMRALLAAADVVVSPRQVCWGFPIKVLNYMAAGRPIVAAAGSAQGLRHMESAWVVPNGDATAFAQAILALLADRELAERLGQTARFEVQCRYAWPACAAATEEVYTQVMA